MGQEQLQCSSCGHILNIKDAVGVWIQCPKCGASFMIDHIPTPVATSVEKDEAKKAYYFPQECDFQSFRDKCFDLMMESSPGDIFSELKVIEEKQCYLPYVSGIGGEKNDTYDAEYVGADKHDVIMQKCKHLSYKNNDKRFGTFCRTMDKGTSRLEAVSVDKALMAALPKWAANADELHYYPLYCMVCSYKGKTFSFISMGDKDIKCPDMPKDNNLHRGPYLVSLSNSERVSYAKKAAKFAAPVIILCLLLYFWQDAVNLYESEKEYFLKHWTTSHERNGWFAYVLFTFYFLWKAIIIYVGSLVGAIVTYYASFCILWLAILIGVYIRNRYVINRCLNNLEEIQQRKQQDAYAQHGVHLKELYDNEKDLY